VGAVSRAALLVVNINLDPATLDGCRTISEVLEDLEPRLEITVAHWRDVGPKLWERLQPVAVVLGPNENPFPSYPIEFQNLLSWVRELQAPILGICGGHQVLALAHGSTVAPVFDVAPATESYAGMPKVKGEIEITIVDANDPLVAGLAPAVVMAASHVDEVKEVPHGFTLLAESSPSRIQMFRAEDRPHVGVQFHPERPAGEGAGRRLLLNWLKSLPLQAG